MQIYRCSRCDHEWASRLNHIPKKCAKCRAIKWWNPARIKKKKTANLNSRGRPRLYPINALKMGESIFLPWFILPNGWPDERRNISMNMAIRQEERRFDKRFRLMPKGFGLQVLRLR